MSMKELITEKAKELTVNVDLAQVFEQVDLTPETKTALMTVFESSVKSASIEMTEALVGDIATEAAIDIEKGIALKEAELVESMDAYLNTIAENWLEENKLAVEYSLKTKMFEGLVQSMKTIFVENNISVPEDSVNVVESLVEENDELRALNDQLLKDKTKLVTEVNTNSICEMVDAKTKNLAESIKEKVFKLASVLPFNESFESKLDSIIDVHKNINVPGVDNTDTNALNEQNDGLDNPQNLNFQNGNQNQDPKKPNDIMSKYINASR